MACGIAEPLSAGAPDQWTKAIRTSLLRVRGQNACAAAPPRYALLGKGRWPTSIKLCHNPSLPAVASATPTQINQPRPNFYPGFQIHLVS
jgi:hypothetical protein